MLECVFFVACQALSNHNNHGTLRKLNVYKMASKQITLKAAAAKAVAPKTPSSPAIKVKVVTPTSTTRASSTLIVVGQEGLDYSGS